MVLKRTVIVLIILGIGIGGYVIWQGFVRGIKPIEKPDEKLKTEERVLLKEEKGPKTVISKKCEIPEKIDGYTKQAVSKIPIEGPGSPKGVVSGIMISYSDWNIIAFLDFDTQENANNYLSNVKKEGFKDCEVSDINGVCKFSQISGSAGTNIEGNFMWVEVKVVKTITTLVQGRLNVSVVETEKKAKENLNLFVSQFKNCEF